MIVKKIIIILSFVLGVSMHTYADILKRHQLVIEASLTRFKLNYLVQQQFALYSYPENTSGEITNKTRESVSLNNNMIAKSYVDNLETYRIAYINNKISEEELKLMIKVAKDIIDKHKHQVAWESASYVGYRFWE